MADTPTADIRFSPFVLSKFIEMYKESACLWNQTHALYKKDNARRKALENLLSMVKEHYPQANLAYIVRKIDSIRSCHRRERRRIETEQKEIKDPVKREKIKSTLWYYDMLTFLNGYEARRLSYDNMKIIKRESGEEEEDLPDDDEQPYEPSMENYQSDYNVSTSMIDVNDSSGSIKRYIFEDDQNKSSKRACTEIEDEYDAIGINVAAKLRILPPNIRIIAEKLINDVLYQAQMNGLNSSTVISTPDPFKQDIII